MDELRLQHIEESVQELEGQYGAQGSLPQEVEELLGVLQSGHVYLARQDAAEQLGKVGTSSPRIVRALIAAYESDAYAIVNRAAARSLHAPVHQEYLERNPDLMEATERALQQRPGAEAGVGAVVQAISPTGTYAKMRKEVRSWGLWLLAIGVLSLILSGLSGSWGVMLLIVGLASFVFRETAMFVVYGIILAWAALNNILSGQATWIVVALVQLGLTFHVFRRYVRYRRAEQALDRPPGPQRASRAFPQIGCALGALALAGLVIIFAGAVLLSVGGGTDMTGSLVWLESLVTGLAVLGLATAVASLLSGYGRKLVAVLGIVASSLVLLVELALFLLALLLAF